MIHMHSFNGVTAKTGDILFTHDGDEGSLFGRCWQMIGRVFPGEFSHAALYIGPRIRFVESAARGVEVVEFASNSWDAVAHGKERLLVDQLIGIGDPIAGHGISAARETEIRENVVAYCLRQASEEKAYNFNVFNPETDGAFYCSQLVYKAYATQGIDLHRQTEKDAGSPWAAIVFPEELWNACKAKELVPAQSPLKGPNEA
jgi:Permuted papain-like amidase enzyme, YaeF/YiiX, C92 family